MSAVGDAFTALKNVVLLHERLDAVRKDIDRLNGDLGGVAAFAHSMNVRLVRVETLLEMSGRTPQPPAIGGN